MFLLDTNICIYFMKNSYPKLTERLLSHSPSELSISAVTVYELEYGASKSGWGEKNRQMSTDRMADQSTHVRMTIT